MGHIIAAYRTVASKRKTELKPGLTQFRVVAYAILASAALPMDANAQQASSTNPAPSTPPASSTSSEIGVLPEEYLTGQLPPGGRETVMEETFISEDGVETIIRTRRIEPRRAPPPVQASYLGAPVQYGTNGERLAPGAAPGYAAPTSPPPPSQQPTTSYNAPNGTAGGQNVMTHEQWIAECERRTQQGDSGEYNCQAALEGHLSQHSPPNSRGPAARSIPPRAPGLVYSSQSAPQTPVVPVEYVQQRQVVVREIEREVPDPSSIPVGSIPN